MPSHESGWSLEQPVYQSKLFTTTRSGPKNVKSPGFIAEKRLPHYRARTRGVRDSLFGTGATVLPLFGSPMASWTLLLTKAPMALMDWYPPWCPQEG